MSTSYKFKYYYYAKSCIRLGRMLLKRGSGRVEGEGLLKEALPILQSIKSKEYAEVLELIQSK